LEQAVAAVFGVPPSALHAPRRLNAQVAHARHVAMYLAHVVFGLSLSRTGALFGRDRTTVAHSCAVVEDRRESPAFDRALNILEGALRAAHHRCQNSGGQS